MENIQDLFTQAQTLKDNGQTQKAIEKFTSTAHQAASQNQSSIQTNAIHMIGVCYLMERDYDKATKELKQAADLYQKQNNHHGVGNVQRDLGLAFFYRKQYDQARYWLDLSAQNLGKTQDKAALGITLAKSGLLFKKLHQWDKSNLMFKQALSLIREQGHWFFEATTMIDWSILAYKKKDYHQTITKLWAALGVIFQAGAQERQKRRLAEIYGLLAISYFRLGNIEWSVNLFNTSLEFVKEIPEASRGPVLKFNKTAKFIKKLYKKDINKYREIINNSPITELRKMGVN